MGQPNVHQTGSYRLFTKIGHPNISSRELAPVYKNETTQCTSNRELLPLYKSWTPQYIKQGVSPYLQKWDNPVYIKQGVSECLKNRGKIGLHLFFREGPTYEFKHKYHAGACTHQKSSLAS